MKNKLEKQPKFRGDAIDRVQFIAAVPTQHPANPPLDKRGLAPT